MWWYLNMLNYNQKPHGKIRAVAGESATQAAADNLVIRIIDEINVLAAI